MKNFNNHYYDTSEDHSEKDILRYFFISKGVRDIVKVIQYQYVDHYDSKPLFNLGFGDYDFDTGNISDEEVSCNNDPYKVFHTVLNTIPQLFDKLGNITLIVQGSDSKTRFIEKCKAACTRRCEKECKKAHRRINIYRAFIDKNYDILSREYTFKGGEIIDGQHIIEKYKIGKAYNSVFVTRKKS